MLKNKLLHIWLCACVALVFAMIIVGGYTRLTHSGLSIVEWKPITGIVPPLNEGEWLDEFSKYKNFPEFQKINKNISLGDFKQIYLVEYFHRLLGRITGIFFFLPLIFFRYCKIITPMETKYFSFIAILILLQGGIGWIMVKSGLVDNPHVSQYKLALHLFMACIIVIMLVLKTREVQGVIATSSAKQYNKKIDMLPYNNIENISIYTKFSIFLLLLQIVSGAFVAGLRAGLVFNTFPLMNGEFVPGDLFFMKPWYINFFENITMVQFIHRSLGILNVINILFYSYKKNNKVLASLILIQLILGVLTLIYQVPMALALLHQAMAIILLITFCFSAKAYKIKG